MIDQNSGPVATSLERPLGANLEPVLRENCDRLSSISWFRADWQRGGALTGFATFQDENDGPRDVVVKLPVPPREKLWLNRLQSAGDVAPRLYASGDELGGYDMAWVVMERLSHGPLGSKWGGNEFDHLIEAAGRFYLASNEFPAEGEADDRDWDAINKRSRDNVKRHNVQDEQRWNKALKKAHKKMGEWTRIWKERSTDGWVHGDLHMGNAMTRNEPPKGPALLFDFARTQRGNWIADGVYLEHLYWARRDRLGGRKLCKLLAQKRKKLGLAVDKDWSQFAAVRRALMAMSTPASLDQHGNPKHVAAALEVLEREV